MLGLACKEMQQVCLRSRFPKACRFSLGVAFAVIGSSAESVPRAQLNSSTTILCRAPKYVPGCSKVNSCNIVEHVLLWKDYTSAWKCGFGSESSVLLSGWLLQTGWFWLDIWSEFFESLWPEGFWCLARGYRMPNILWPFAALEIQWLCGQLANATLLLNSFWNCLETFSIEINNYDTSNKCCHICGEKVVMKECQSITFLRMNCLLKNRELE